MMHDAHAHVKFNELLRLIGARPRLKVILLRMQALERRHKHVCAVMLSR